LSLSSGYGLPALTNYKAVSGSNWGSPDTLSGYSPDFVHKKEFYGYLGRNADTRNGLAKGDGIICAGWDGAVITGDFEIRDGLSNTLAIGESVPSWCAWSTWYWWLGSTATCGIPLNYEKPGVSLRDNYDDMGNTYGFMSRHGVGAIFGLADGSTRLINEAICGDGGSEDMRLYRALSTIDGGERAEVPE
jgi:hypothetical protein